MPTGSPVNRLGRSAWESQHTEASSINQAVINNRGYITQPDRGHSYLFTLCAYVLLRRALWQRRVTAADVRAFKATGAFAYSTNFMKAVILGKHEYRNVNLYVLQVQCVHFHIDYWHLLYKATWYSAKYSYIFFVKPDYSYMLDNPPVSGFEPEP